MRFRSVYVNDNHAALEFGTYRDGTVALRVIGGNGVPLCTATVCLSGQAPEPGNVFIKDYAENEGVLQALQDAGILGVEVRRVPCGYAEAVEVPLLLGAELVR